jgi:hypothetical protein
MGRAVGLLDAESRALVEHAGLRSSMTAFHAFHRGWLAASRSKVALLLMWFSYTLIAKIVAVPAVVLLLDPLAHSRMSGRLLSHFEVGWLGDLVDIANSAAGALSGAAVVAGVLTWLVAVLFAGGVLTMLDERWERFSFALFCAAAGECFWRILRLSFFGLVCFALAVMLGRLPSLLAKRLYGQGMEGWPLAAAGIVGSVVTVLLLGWVATVLDYAKLRLVSGHTRGSFKVLMRSFLFVFHHISKTMGVWVMNAMLFALLGMVYLKFSNEVRATTTGTILLLIVVQQVFILFRTAQRIAGWGSALEIYGALALPIPPPFEPQPVPCLAGDARLEFEAGTEASPDPQEWDGYGI